MDRLTITLSVISDSNCVTFSVSIRPLKTNTTDSPPASL
jgi:hypothetical protein